MPRIEAPTKLMYPLELLQQIAAGVKREESTRAAYLQVTITSPTGQEFTFDLPTALDSIANGLYWDERGNWGDARLASVEVL